MQTIPHHPSSDSTNRVSHLGGTTSSFCFLPQGELLTPVHIMQCCCVVPHYFHCPTAPKSLLHTSDPAPTKRHVNYLTACASQNSPIQTFLPLGLSS
ncbi:hypothetical protein HKD37_07G018945 [Glycine soja]